MTKKKQTIKRIVKEASRQSENLIVDLRFAKIDENIAFRILEHEFNSSRRIKRLVIIRKSGLLKYKKQTATMNTKKGDLQPSGSKPSSLD